MESNHVILSSCFPQVIFLTEKIAIQYFSTEKLLYYRSSPQQNVATYMISYTVMDKNSLGKLIWRNDVIFTYLHSGHLGISMMDSNTTEYIEKKIFSNYPAKGNSEIVLPHLVLYFTHSRI